MSVGLFVSKLNFKLKKKNKTKKQQKKNKKKKKKKKKTNVSRRLEPHPLAIDAFSIVCNETFYYILTPFSLMPKGLQKMVPDATEAEFIAPLWPTQAWWASPLQIAYGPYLLLPNK